MTGLSVSRLVRASYTLSPLAVPRRSFGTLLIVGDSDVISGYEKIRDYTSIESVATDFGLEAPEYEAAALYFGQNPRPQNLSIGRWIRTASSGLLNGGALTAAQKLISAWTSITSGGFKIPINGTEQVISGLNFSAQTTLNGIAALIEAALSGASCVYDGNKFVVTSDATGAGVKSSGNLEFTGNPSAGVRATNTIELDANPTNGDTVTIQGTLITFVTGTPGAGEVQIGSDENETAANLQTYLEESVDSNLILMTYSTIGAITTITAKVYSTAGNAYTLAKSGSDITIGGGTFSGGVNPDTIAINGVVFTFVPSSTPSPSVVQIIVGSTNLLTCVNAAAKLNASVNSSVNVATYTAVDNVLEIEYDTVGTGGDAFTLDESSSNITKSGANLTGGAVGSSVGYATSPDSGQDISAQLKMTSSLAGVPVPGYDAQSPVEAVASLANFSPNWYGLMFAASVMPTDEQNIAVAAFIQAVTISRMFGVTITNPNVLDPNITNDLASQMKDLNYTKTMGQYAENEFAIASLFGRAFSVNFNANRSTINLMYKQEPGIISQVLTETEANTLQDKRCNVFAQYDNSTSIIQYGVMFGQAYIDEIHGLDWFQNAEQTELYNLLYTSKTKIPQTEAGSNQLVTASAIACEQALNNGLIGPGVWNSEGFGQLESGMYLKDGYYIYIEPLSLQSQSQREARIAPPIQIALKLAGAFNEIDMIINVNR